MEFFWPRKLSLGEKRESEYERDDAKRRDLVFVTANAAYLVRSLERS